ncbi:hypothetical protein GGR57DRAFT_491405 [Xylariaceae sp. FL1272]|nr:hypothetical protein GGR57DRAFT_491405 [Xylariaceae sp. FL1272]
MAAAGISPTKRASCRCFPGDDCWPSPADWNALNQSVHGSLIATISIASVCNNSFPGVSYDEEKLRIHPMAAIFANLSCDPFTPRDAQSVIGTHVHYAVNASSVVDYRRTIAFAKAHNIRLVIRNTGHDLILWTHYMKGTTILDYASSTSAGKAMKIGAGVITSEAQKAAGAQGHVVVEGDDETVGIAGGYTQSGGTSPHASKFGLSDQVLEWEVVTADGTLRTATPTLNSHLSWSLSGGGGGTYGAVLSMTVKLHNNMPTNIIRAFVMKLPPALEAGATLYWIIVPGNTFVLPQTSFIQMDFSTFQDAYNTLNPVMNISAVSLGGRSIPRSLVVTEHSASSLVGAIKSIVNNLAVFAAVSVDVSKPPSIPNSAHPAWRVSYKHQHHQLAYAYGTQYDNNNYTVNVAAQDFINDILNPPLEALTPGGPAYLNEANVNQKDWQQTFYGSNYDRLLSVKKECDPEIVFYGKTAVGSEAFEVTAEGRICLV